MTEEQFRITKQREEIDRLAARVAELEARISDWRHMLCGAAVDADWRMVDGVRHEMADLLEVVLPTGSEEP